MVLLSARDEAMQSGDECSQNEDVKDEVGSQPVIFPVAWSSTSAAGFPVSQILFERASTIVGIDGLFFCRQYHSNLSIVTVL